MKAADIAPARIYKQQIANSRFTKPKDLVAYMGALQAQDYAMAKWAIGLRVPGSTQETVEQSLNKGELLRAHVLRPTWHIIPAKDIYWMLALSASKIRTLMRNMDKQLELTEKIFTKSNAVIEKCLAGAKYVSREEIGSRLEQAGIHTNENRLSHLLMRSELEGIACSGKPVSNKISYALLEQRVPKKTLPGKEESLALLAQKYFTSHGPATLQDFSWWSGLTLTHARQGLEAVKKQFNCIKIAGAEYWVDGSFPLDKNKRNTGIHLLPAYDEFIISYKSRAAALLPEHRKKVLTVNGIFFPVIVENGQVVATWKRKAVKDQLAVEANFFQQPSAKLLGAVKKSAKQLAAFYGNKLSLAVNT